MCVCEDAAERALLAARELGGFELGKEAAAAEANDELAEGATGSGTTVLRKACHDGCSSRGLMLRWRSPKPSTEAGAGAGEGEIRRRRVGRGRWRIGERAMAQPMGMPMS